MTKARIVAALVLVFAAVFSSGALVAYRNLGAQGALTAARLKARNGTPALRKLA
jgi:hypothetical protein